MMALVPGMFHTGEIAVRMGFRQINQKLRGRAGVKSRLRGEGPIKDDGNAFPESKHAMLYLIL